MRSGKERLMMRPDSEKTSLGGVRLVGAPAMRTEQHAANVTTSRLRILLFANSVAIGGMETHIEMIARDLDRSKAEVFTICPQWESIDPWAATLAASADHSARITPDRRYGLLALAKEAIRFWRQLRNWRIQVMHIHLTSYVGGACALLIARLAGVPVVICTEHLAPQHVLPWTTRLRCSLFSRNINRIVCVSLKNRQLRQRFMYTPSDRTTVINNGVDVAEFEPTSAAELQRMRTQLGIPDNVPVVGTAVRFVEEKGLPYLLDALPKVLSAVPNTYLLMVGDGPQRGQLEEQARRLGISERVIFAGFQTDPRPYLSLMNAFVLPWPYGSASIGLLEAMAMRRAVIVTFGGEGEPVLNEVTGLRTPPRDPSSLARAMLRIIQDPAFEHRLGEQARRRIAEEFSSQSIANQLLAMFTRELQKATRTTTRG